MIKKPLPIAAAVLALGLAGSAFADDQQPVCDQVVTHSITLTTDLTGCTGDGLRVGAPGITIDLGGHTIAGAPSDSAQGVNDAAGYPGLTVTNGTITGFGNGVMTDNHADNVVVSHLRTSGMVFSGVLLQRSEGGEISDVTADATGQVQGLVLSGMDGAELDHSTVTGSNDAGIYVVFGDGNIVDHNVASSHHQGIYVQSAPNTLLADNHTDGSTVDGSMDGIDVVGASAGTTVSGNHTDGNGHDGIYSPSGGITIADNHADENGNLGIEAAAGDTDAGKNHAQGNGNPLECSGVGCQP